MKSKKEIILLTVIVLALSLYLLFNKTNRSLYRLPGLRTIPIEKISKIEISKKRTDILLEKKNGKWVISPNGYWADSNMVKDMLGVISRLKLTALVSEARDYGRYGLDNDDKIAVKAWMGNKLKREFEIGKTASTYRHTFVKIAGNYRVYHARGNFRNSFDKTVEDLRDKQVLSFPEADIQEIDIKTPKKSIVFLKKELSRGKGKNSLNAAPKAIWQTPKGKKADESGIHRLLSSLSDLRCKDFIEDRNKKAFTNAIYTIRLKGMQEYSLSLFAKKKGSQAYPAISSGSAYPFIVAGWRAERIMEPPSKLLKR
ncbi:MAG: DUF4340 domain-containing protein [Nitrospiraceae bacterium]|nr:DUF4340 domain-containing protein [Nitrospiraceae bacterium]